MIADIEEYLANRELRAEQAGIDKAVAFFTGNEDGKQIVTEGERFSVESLGTPYYQFKGNAKGSVEYLKQKKEGQAIAALYHPSVGYIDLPWGEEGTGHSDGFGLAKLIKYHPEFVDNLQEIIDSMSEVSRSSNRVNLESEKYKAGIRLAWNNVEKTWLLTLFEKKNSVSNNRTDTDGISNGDERNDTATPQNTVSTDKDTNSSEDSNSDEGNFRISPEVRDEMAQIEAIARVNGTYLKAPNGVDTKLNAEQWALVRTKAF